MTSIDNFELEDPGPALSRRRLQAIERELEFTFPADFVQLYLRSNGGVPVRTVFKAKNGEFMLHEVFPLDDAEDSFEEMYAALKLEEPPILPPQLIAFADDPGGDFFCFSTSPIDFGSIWHYSCEAGDPALAKIQLLAPSLSEFACGLQPDGAP